MISPQISTPPDYDNIDLTQISTIPNCSDLHDFTSNLDNSIFHLGQDCVPNFRQDMKKTTLSRQPDFINSPQISTTHGDFHP